MLPLRRHHPELCRTFPSAPTVIGLDAATANPHMTRAWERDAGVLQFVAWYRRVLIQHLCDEFD